MSLATNVSELATAVATEVKRNRTWINGNAADLTALSTTNQTSLVGAVNEVDGDVGDLAALSTTNKTSVVAAVNEVAGSVAGASGIDDGVTSTTTSWSSQKTSDEIGAASTADRDRANHTGVQAASTITGLATVATSGLYTDLSGKPAIPASYSDLTGTVPQSALPAVALTEFLGAVASETAMLALTGQRGDWATRTDLGTDWQLIADNPAQLASWREMTYPASPVSSVNGRTGAVTGLAEAADLTALTTAVGNTESDFVGTFTAGLA